MCSLRRNDRSYQKRKQQIKKEKKKEYNIRLGRESDPLGIVQENLNFELVVHAQPGICPGD